MLRQFGWTTSIRPLASAFSYPQGFVIKLQDVSKLAQFTPTPITSTSMNPTMAKGDLAGIKPPDLEVRVYPGGAGHSLEDWLGIQLLLPPSTRSRRPTLPEWQSEWPEGLPGNDDCTRLFGLTTPLICAYQLTPMSVEGEAMIETFALSRNARHIESHTSSLPRPPTDSPRV